MMNGLLLALILILFFINLDRVPFIGSHSKAVGFVEKTCNSKDEVVRLKNSALASELNPYWNDFASAVSNQLALKHSISTVDDYYKPEDPIYIETKNNYKMALFKVAQICVNHMKKK